MVSESTAPQAIEALHDNRLKRRLLGAAVLIALAVIFLPLIFDGAGTESQFRSIEPLESEPPYDLEILQESALPELSGSTVVEFVEDNSINELPDGAVKTDPVMDAPQDRILVTDAPAEKKPALVEAAKPVAVVETRVARPDPQEAAVVRTDPEQAWLIQTASFKDKINALSLRSELKKEGYPVEVKVAEMDGQSIFRVFVGPVNGEQQADSVKSALDRKLNRKTLLVVQ